MGVMERGGEEGRRGGKEACSSALLARGATLAFTLSYKDGLHISKRTPPPRLVTSLFE